MDCIALDDIVHVIDYKDTDPDVMEYTGPTVDLGVAINVLTCKQLINLNLLSQIKNFPHGKIIYLMINNSSCDNSCSQCSYA